MGFSSSLHIGAALKVVGEKSDVFDVAGEALTYFGEAHPPYLYSEDLW